MNLKQWLKRNKEGAIVGGIAGFIWGFVQILLGATGIPTSSIQMKLILFPLILTGFLKEQFSFNLNMVMILIIGLSILLGALIGAFIDSKWRPLR